MKASLYAEYQASNPEKFNEDVIYGKDKEDVLEAITDVLKMAEMVPGVSIENIRYETDESKFTMLKTETDTTKPVLESRFDKVLYEVYFETDKDKRGEAMRDDLGNPVKEKHPITFYTEKNPAGKVQFMENRKAFYIPKLLNKTFYVNNDVRYYPIYQLVSKCAHPVKNGITIRSLSMAITIEKLPPTHYTDVNDNVFMLEPLILKGFHRKVNPLLYYLAKLNLPDTLKFFDVDKVFRVDTCDDTPKFESYETAFKVNKGVHFIAKTELLSHPYYSRVAAMVLEALSAARYEEDVYDNECWKKTLGKNFTGNPTAFSTKADATLMSFVRLVDASAQKYLYMPEEDKESTFTLIRWLIRNYDELYKIDDSALNNKRVRILEYMLFPFRIYMSKQVFRVLNTPRITEAVVKRMFNSIGVMDVAKQMITNDLLRYYNATNEINLYNCHLKYTFRGMQSLTRRTKNTLRDVQPSYVGRLSLVASSAGDPGMTGTITPFAKIDKGLFTDTSLCSNWAPDPSVNVSDSENLETDEIELVTE